MTGYNESPEGLTIITEQEFLKIFFHYCLQPIESRQVRSNGTFDLRMFDIPNFENKKLGVAIMKDWYDSELHKNRPTPILRFCKYGIEEDWVKFQNKFAAQFAGDNS